MDNKNTIYIYIMDYSVSSIYEIELHIENGEEFDVADILDIYGFNEDECHYMVTNDKINNIIPLKNEHL